MTKPLNYKIRRDQDNDRFEIVETFTDQVIETHTKFNDAQKRTGFLNKGGGFDGNTPPFILKDYPLYKGESQDSINKNN